MCRFPSQRQHLGKLVTECHVVRFGFFLEAGFPFKDTGFQGRDVNSFPEFSCFCRVSMAFCAFLLIVQVSPSGGQGKGGPSPRPSTFQCCLMNLSHKQLSWPVFCLAVNIEIGGNRAVFVSESWQTFHLGNDNVMSQHTERTVRVCAGFYLLTIMPPGRVLEEGFSDHVFSSF